MPASTKPTMLRRSLKLTLTRRAAGTAGDYPKTARSKFSLFQRPKPDHLAFASSKKWAIWVSVSSNEGQWVNASSAS